jgi:predicted dehydrogenase
LRVALAGLGAAALRGHMPALTRLEREGVLTLVGAADPDVDRRTVAGAEQPAVPLFPSAEAMIDAVRADLLVVATGPSAHAPIAVLGAKHGMHVLCEKPLAVTRAQHDQIAAAYQDHPSLGLVAVHQYCYAPMWISVARWARLADRLGIPFSCVVHVERDGTDRHAVSSWREDVPTSGGMLADHGVHFLALGYTISSDLEVLDVSRTRDRGCAERSAATVRLGSGTLELHVSAAAPTRRTRLSLRSGCILFEWNNETALLLAGKRIVHSWRAAPLSDRRYVDRLYVPLYRDLIGGLRDTSWRTSRTAEALTVGRVLVNLLEMASR